MTYDPNAPNQPIDGPYAHGLELGVVGVDGTVVGPATAEAGEHEPGRLSRAEIDDYKRDWTEVQAGQDAFVVCGDKRPFTAESNAAFAAYARTHPSRRRLTMISPEAGTTSVFGALFGAAKAYLTAGVAYYGPSFIDRVGGINGVAQLLARRGDGSFTLHTSQHAEEHPAEFQPGSINPVDCKYSVNLGATAVLLGENKADALLLGGALPDTHLQAVARKDQNDIFDSNPIVVDSLFSASHAVAEHLASLTPEGDAKKFVVGRDAYAEISQPLAERPDRPAVPIAVLQTTPPAHYSELAVVLNFNPNLVGKAGRVYRVDVARVTDEIMRATRELAVPAEYIMRAIVLDTAPTRAVLGDTNHDGTLDPERVRMGWFGSNPLAVARQLDNEHGA